MDRMHQTAMLLYGVAAKCVRIALVLPQSNNSAISRSYKLIASSEVDFR